MTPFRHRTMWVLLGVLLCSAVLPLKSAPPRIPPPSPLYQNLEPIEPPERPPQVDAIAFDNQSIFVTIDPRLSDGLNPLDPEVRIPLEYIYQAQSVRFWTNSGTMVSVPGFQFETLPDVRRLPARLRRKPGANLPKPALVFHNEGDITVGGLLRINAERLINPGRLEGDLGSRMYLVATNGLADLSYGTLRIGRVQSQFAPAPGFFFFGDPELVTLYGATGTNGAYNTTNRPPLFLPTAFGFNPFFTNIFGTSVFFTNFSPVQIQPYQVLVNPTVLDQPITTRITNLLSFPEFCSGGHQPFVHVVTNALGEPLSVSVAFLEPTSLIDTNVTMNVRFSGFGGGIIVEYSSVEFDIIEQQYRTNYVTLTDSGFIGRFPPPTNQFSSFPAPNNYSLFRGRAPLATFGVPTNATFSPSLFWNTNFSTNFVWNDYAAVSYQIGPTNRVLFTNTFVSSILGGRLRSTFMAPLDPTNFPSRIEVRARNLNLERTRIRAEQAVDLRAPNVISSAFSAVDAPFLSFDLGTTNESWTIANLAPAVVNRAQGRLSAYTATWTVNVTNSSGVTPVDFHVLVVGNCLQFTQPTVLHNLTLKGTNIVIEDPLLVNAKFAITSKSLTIGSNASIQLPIRMSWAFTNLGGLAHLTNYGLINVPGSGAYFGTQPTGYIFPRPPRRSRRAPAPRVLPYENFVNHGLIVAATDLIDASYVENTGNRFTPAALVATNGPIVITGNTVLISNALLSAGGNIEIRADDVTLRNSVLSAGRTNRVGDSFRIQPGSVIIAATNSFGDEGTAFTNHITTTAGIRLERRPEFAGDLLGTSVRVMGGVITASRIVWSADDVGPTPEGFANNLALGRLTLDGGTNILGPVGNFFSFNAGQNGNALYVDHLELIGHATNFNFALGVASNFTIYFGDVSGVEPQKLEDDSGGRLQWVTSFTGPQSSTNLVYPDGNTYTFNAGLVRSKDLDSDGDGFNNHEDCTPIPVGDNPVIYQGALCDAIPMGLAAARSLAASTPDLHLTLTTEGGEAVLRWNSPRGSRNVVEFTHDLSSGTWQTLTNFINGATDRRVTVKDVTDAPLRVYRVRVESKP